jgi:hypothetical protein
MLWVLGLSVVVAASNPSTLTRPHVLMVLQDDFGWFDFHGAPLMEFHPSLTALASEGIEQGERNRGFRGHTRTPWASSYAPPCRLHVVL